MQNKKAAELVTLHALKRGRAEMVQDFLAVKPEIYAPSYRYENSPVLLKLAREKYFMAWLSRHWHIFSIIATQSLGEERRNAETVFARVFLELLSKWSIVKTMDTPLDLGIALIEDMQVALIEFIKAGDNADLMCNKLEVALEKNRVVFERMLKQLN